MIKICTPFYSDFNENIPGLKELQAAGFPFRHSAAQSPYVAQSRNALVNCQASQAIRQNVGGEYSHFLFIDSDIGFGLRHVQALMEMDVDIACAPYQRHGRPDEYQVGTFERQGLFSCLRGRIPRISGRYSTQAKGIEKVGWCGAGFLLVKAGVFNRIKYPWFRYGVLERAGCAEIVGEDIYFSHAAARVGYSIWCNFDVPVFHRLRA